MRPNNTDKGKHKQKTKTTNPQTNTPKTKARFVTRVGNVSLLRKVKHGAMNSAFALSTSPSRHLVI